MKNAMRPRGPVSQAISTKDTFVAPPATEATAKLTVRLTPDLHKAVKRAALDADISIQDYVTRLLQSATGQRNEN